MAFGTFEVHAGSFALGNAHQVVRGHLLMKVSGRFLREKIPLSEITDLEVASEESLNRLGGALGWGLAGDALLGPVGLLAGLIRGGRGKRITFVCRLRDGRKFLATASSAVFAQMRTSLAVTEFGRVKEAPLAPDTYDHQRWAALVQYDQNISSAVDLVRPFGQNYVDELASAYLALNDKEYLSRITDDIISRAKSERNSATIRKVETPNERDEARVDTAVKSRCRVCDKSIYQASKTCPYCGTNEPHVSTRGVNSTAWNRVVSIGAWIFAILFGLGGLGFISEGNAAGYPLIASAIVACPLSANFIRTYFKVSVPGWARASGAFALFMIASLVSPKAADTSGVSESSTSSATVAASTNAEQKPVREVIGVFNKCLIEKARSGGYASSDGGKSAMRMLVACKPQWDAYADACEQSGKTDGACTQESAILAQMALKSIGK